MNQPTLFDSAYQGGSRRAHARPTDPPTSHQAAASLGDLRDSQHAVLNLFTKYGAGISDEHLIWRAREKGVAQSDSGIRSRRAELVDLGFLRHTGQYGRTAAGRRTQLWQRIR